MNSVVLAVLLFLFCVPQAVCSEQFHQRYEDLARKYEELKLQVGRNTNRFRKLSRALALLGSDLFGEEISESVSTTPPVTPVTYTPTPFQVNSVLIKQKDGVSKVSLHYTAEEKLLVQINYPLTDLQVKENFQNGKGSATVDVSQEDRVGFLLRSPDELCFFTAYVPITNETRTDKLTDVLMKTNFSGELIFRKNESLTVSVRFPKVQASSEVSDYRVVCTMTIRNETVANTVSEISNLPRGPRNHGILQTSIKYLLLQDYNEAIIRINGNRQDTSGLLMIQLLPRPKYFDSPSTHISVVYNVPVRRSDQTSPFPADFLAFSVPPRFDHLTRCRQGSLCVVPISLIGNNPLKIRMWKGKPKKYYKNFRCLNFGRYRLACTLYFRNISRHDGGTYTVKGRDIAGNAIRREITLAVFEPHLFVLRSSKVIEDLPNSLKVQCSVIGWPPADIAFRNSSVWDRQCIEFENSENIHIATAVYENGLSTSIIHFAGPHHHIARVYCGVDNDVEKNGPSEFELLLYKNPNIDIDDAVYRIVNPKHFTV